MFSHSWNKCAAIFKGGTLTSNSCYGGQLAEAKCDNDFVAVASQTTSTIIAKVKLISGCCNRDAMLYIGDKMRLGVTANAKGVSSGSRTPHFEWAVGDKKLVVPGPRPPARDHTSTTLLLSVTWPCLARLSSQVCSPTRGTR